MHSMKMHFSAAMRAASSQRMGARREKRKIESINLAPLNMPAPKERRFLIAQMRLARAGRAKRHFPSCRGLQRHSFQLVGGASAPRSIFMQMISTRLLLIHMRADSRSLFDAIAKHSQTREKRLLIDLAARDGISGKKQQMLHGLALKATRRIQWRSP